MPLTVVNRQPEALDLDQSADPVLGAREPTTDLPNLRVRLTRVDQLALDTLVDPSDVPAIVRWTEDEATALTGPNRIEARIRLISRAVASERARMLVLEGLLDEQLAAGKLPAASEIDKALNSTTKRLALLLAEHRAACSTGHRPTVLVGHADQVHVEGGRR